MSLQKDVERVNRFLSGWFAESGELPFLGRYAGAIFQARGPNVCWDALNRLENAVEQWAIDLDVPTGHVDEAYPDSPMADNIIRKLMVIRGSGRANAPVGG